MKPYPIEERHWFRHRGQLRSPANLHGDELSTGHVGFHLDSKVIDHPGNVDGQLGLTSGCLGGGGGMSHKVTRRRSEETGGFGHGARLTGHHSRQEGGQALGVIDAPVGLQDCIDAGQAKGVEKSIRIL